MILLTRKRGSVFNTASGEESEERDVLKSVITFAYLSLHVTSLDVRVGSTLCGKGRREGGEEG